MPGRRGKPAVTPRILIPVRALATGKTRLGAILTPTERAALVKAMFHYVEATAQQVAATHVLSRDPSLLALADRPLLERASGLNGALEQASIELGGTEPIMVLHADLPLVTTGDLHAMLALLDHADVVAAPDKRGKGTNALLLARPRLLPYAFGADSLAAYRATAERQGLRIALCRRPGLEHDLDTPEDLRLLSNMTADGMRVGNVPLATSDGDIPAG